MYLLEVKVKYAKVGYTLRIGRVNVTKKPQILILTQSTHHTSVIFDQNAITQDNNTHYFFFNFSMVFPY